MTKYLFSCLILVFPVSTFSQGNYIYVDAKDLTKYGVKLNAEKEEHFGRWCLDFVYPKVMKDKSEFEFHHSTYLLKRDYSTPSKQLAPAQYFELLSKPREGFPEERKTEFCIASEFLIGAEVQLFYVLKNGVFHSPPEIIWIQNIDKVLNEK
ncbi:MAG: hypothetical protein AAF431_07550 [Pseudomonadota bacterium]